MLGLKSVREAEDRFRQELSYGAYEFPQESFKRERAPPKTSIKQ